MDNPPVSADSPTKIPRRFHFSTLWKTGVIILIISAFWPLVLSDRKVPLPSGSFGDQKFLSSSTSRKQKELAVKNTSPLIPFKHAAIRNVSVADNKVLFGVSVYTFFGIVAYRADCKINPSAEGSYSVFCQNANPADPCSLGIC